MLSGRSEIPNAQCELSTTTWHATWCHAIKYLQKRSCIVSPSSICSPLSLTNLSLALPHGPRSLLDDNLARSGRLRRPDPSWWRQVGCGSTRGWPWSASAASSSSSFTTLKLDLLTLGSLPYSRAGSAEVRRRLRLLVRSSGGEVRLPRAGAAQALW
jgi:hypothetical protein